MPHPRRSPRARARRRTRRGTLALVLAGGLTALGAATPVAAAPATAPATARTAAPADPDQPLRLRLDTLAPAVLPTSGRVRMTGSVTNTSDEAWTDVRLYAFSGDEPIGDREALAAAARTDPAVEVGVRTTDVGTFDTVEELAPGATARWSIRVPRRLLEVPARTPGVYWLGVHALGTSSAGRDTLADGRARTFVSALGEDAAPVPVSLVLPLRRPVVHAPDGSLARVARWVRDLGPDGPLRAVLDLGAAAGDRGITWLLDPALLAAVQRLAAGNPGRSLEPTLPPEGEEAPDGEPSPSGDGTPGDGDATPGDPSGPTSDDAGTPTGDAGDDADGAGDGDGDGGGEAGAEPPTALEQEAAELARTWLDRATKLLREDAVLALPYADLDVAAAVHRAPDLLTRATDLSAATLAALEVPATPAAAPPGGRLDAEAVTALPDDAVVLLGPGALPNVERSVVELGGHRVVTTDPALSAGGPGPDDPRGGVAVRQRLLAEAALAGLAADGGDQSGTDGTGGTGGTDGTDGTSGTSGTSGTGGTEPVVAVLPDRWGPTDALGFFTGLDDAPWLRLQTVGAAVSGTTTSLAPAVLAYDAEAARAEVGTPALTAATETVRTGALVQSVLTRNDQVATVVARESLGAASYYARRAPVAWRRVVAAVRADLERTLRQVRVEAPQGTVTLSSEVGGFPAALVNELDQPVTVRIEARTTSPITLEAPAEVELQPGERTSVVLRARTRQIGLHEVQLLVTSTEGTPLGSSDVVEIRSAQVSWIIWVVIAGGGTLLFGAIGLRLLRRVRAARRGAEVPA